LREKNPFKAALSFTVMEQLNKSMLMEGLKYKGFVDDHVDLKCL
jgi:hypothetical protein